MRVWQSPIALVVALALAGCHWGPRLENFAPAREVRGADVSLTTRDGISRGELLAVSDSGLLVLLDLKVSFVPASFVEHGKVVDLGADYHFDGAPHFPSTSVNRLRPVSRFPQGVDASLLRRLLQLHGQTSVEVVPKVLTKSGADPSTSEFLERAKARAAFFRDRSVAIAEGYRQIGMDFPSMGEHWVNAGLVVRGRFEVDRPAMLSYATIGNETRLIGVVYAVALHGGESLPDVPGAAGFWHEHNGTVDEESLLPEHVSDESGAHDAHDGTRLALLHVWTGVSNPDGPFVAENWSLPFARLGLGSPSRFPVDAARALSLLSGGEEYFLERARHGTTLGKQAERALDDAIRQCRERARKLVEGEAAGEDAADLSRAEGLSASAVTALAAAWSGMVEKIRAGAGADVANRVQSQR